MALLEATGHRERARRPAAVRRIAYLGSAPTNPYLRLLYTHLEQHGVLAERCISPSLRWLLRARGRIDVLHVHWPEGLYRVRSGPAVLQRPLSWAKLARLALRLAVARRLGIELVWTVHQVLPHERTQPRLDRLAARLLARRARLLLAHDAATAADALAHLGCAAHIVPHGSYRGVYPPGAGRDATRTRLGIPREAVVFLAFGQLRGYKGIAGLLDAFATLAEPELRLLVAGGAEDRAVEALVLEAAAGDARIVPLLNVVPDHEVSDLYAAADAAVVARADGGTSGALVLALTLGTPVVAAARGCYPELVGEAGWLYDPDDPDGLRRALARAAGATRGQELSARARAAAAQADALDWDEAAARLGELLAEITHRPRRAIA